MDREQAPTFGSGECAFNALPIRSVTLDLDGTLVDTVADLACACDAMLADLGHPPLGPDRVRRLVGKGMAVLVERCLAASGRNVKDESERALASFRRHYATSNGREARLYPGVAEGLRRLRAQNLPLAIVTNKPAAFTEPLLRHMGIADYFSVVVSGDTTAYKKPAPEPLLFACARLGVAAAENLHVGDSENDIASARAAGCRILAVPYGYVENEAIDSAACDALVSDLAAAAEYVARHNSGF